MTIIVRGNLALGCTMLQYLPHELGIDVSSQQFDVRYHPLLFLFIVQYQILENPCPSQAAYETVGIPQGPIPVRP
jgi:hypothetical protein